MIQEIEVSLRAWSHALPELPSRELQGALAAPDAPAGLAPEGPGRLILWAATAQDYASHDEPAEELNRQAPGELRAVAAWLARLQPSGVKALSGRGYTVDLQVSAAIDSDTLDLDVPAELSREVGRLGVPLSVTTRSWGP